MKRITPPSKEELQTLLLTNSLKSIGEMKSVSHRTVWKWCRDYELPMRTRGGVTGRNKRPDVTDEMLISDLNEGFNLTQISNRRGISRPAVARRLLKIEARFPNKNYRISKTLDWKEIDREYREGSTEEKLANKYNAAAVTIHRGLRKQGTPIRHRTAHMKGWHAERKQLVQFARQFPADWWDRPLSWRIIGDPLLQTPDYTSNLALTEKLLRGGLLDLSDYGKTASEIAKNRAFKKRVNEVRNWVGRPGGSVVKTSVNSPSGSL